MRGSENTTTWAPALLGALLAAVCVAPMPTVDAAPFPWKPPPVNSCGEIGFDPLARLPDPAQPPPPLLPPRIDIPVPIPRITPVPVPDPPQDNTRIVPDPLPVNPCDNPCPDIRDSPQPQNPNGARTPTPDEPVGEPTGSNTGSASGAVTGSGSGIPIDLPRIEFQPDIEPIPIPVPGEPGERSRPAPPLALQPSEPGPRANPVAAPGVQDVRLVGQVTGRGSENRTDMRWQIDGTDLGLMWETTPGEVAVVFGDTFGDGWSVGGAGADDQDWRSNVIGFSTDRDLSDGLTLETFAQDSPCHAAEILASRKIKNWETTTIPTSGFAIGDRQYLSYMSVNRWSRIPGMWWTNYGGLAYSDDHGRTWHKDPHAKWENFFGLGRFQVAAMVPHGDHVYMFGTPNGRIGVIGLARVPTDEVLNKSAYQYWVDGDWVPAAENDATPLVFGIAGELSVHFDQETDRWRMVYLDPARGAIVLRSAASPQGAWSDAVPLIDTADYPKSYGGFIHPWSTSDDLYFMLSEWDSYNVYLMHARLKPRS